MRGPSTKVYYGIWVSTRNTMEGDGWVLDISDQTLWMVVNTGTRISFYIIGVSTWLTECLPEHLGSTPILTLHGYLSTVRPWKRTLACCDLLVIESFLRRRTEKVVDGTRFLLSQWPWINLKFFTEIGTRLSIKIPKILSLIFIMVYNPGFTSFSCTTSKPSIYVV